MTYGIETAPKDGTVILSNCGFVRYINRKCWASPVEQGWAECDPSGYVYECADNGWWYCEPKIWTSVPDWILS